MLPTNHLRDLGSNSKTEVTMITGAKAMVRCLEAEGVTTVFGYPGAAIHHFYERLSESDTINHVLVRQEQNAGHMASGYARASGGVGVCVVTSGPGATNLITAIATAYMDSIPIIAITGQVRSDLLGHDAFQEVDITGSVSPFTKHSYLIKKASDIPRVFREAFHIATTGRPGPVLIDIPLDIQTQTFRPFSYPKSVNLKGYRPSMDGNPKQIKKVSETISAAKTPLLCIGGGVFSAKAQGLVKRLSEEAGIPVVTTMMGIGALPTDHPMNIGMIGAFGHKTANKALNETDLLIIVGARAADRAITAPSTMEKRAKTIHIDIDPAEIGKNVNTTVPLVGDLSLVLEKLLEERPVANCGKWLAGLKELAKAEKDKIASPRTETIGPKRFLRELGNQMDDHAFVVGDVGQNQLWTAKYLPVKSGRFLTSGGLGTMGYSLPAAIGVKKALPETQTIAVCGDGSAQMMFNELSTLVANDLDVKIVLFNNRTLGLVYELQGIERYRTFGVELPNTPDFQKLAAAYGIPSKKIAADADMAAAISEMLTSKGPFLLECIVSREEGTKTIYEVI